MHRPCPWQAVSVPVQPCESCLVDLMAIFSSCLQSPPTPTHIYHLFCGVSGLQGEEPNRDFQFKFSLHIMSDCGSLHMLTPAAKGSLSMNIAEYHRESFVVLDVLSFWNPWLDYRNFCRQRWPQTYRTQVSVSQWKLLNELCLSGFF